MMNKPFEHRGFMLDVSRHYMPVENIKKLLDAASLLKMNRMHWHLADDQGWRLEIKKYPKLTEIGAFRGESFFGGVSRTENNCGFYTQEEARDIVSYAKDLGIEIIPEIEMPGHESALLAAYPEFGCRVPDDGSSSPYRYQVEVAPGIFPNLICGGREDSLRFLKDILDEVVEIFPFPMVHIGGDEAMKLHWRRCPDCQKKIRALGLKNEDALQRELILEIGAYLSEKGRETIVWNDVLPGGPLPPYFIVQQWLYDEHLTTQFLASGGRIIISDTKNYYYDYPYGTTDVHHIWAYPRIPEYAREFEGQILGLECPLWAERVTNIDRAAFLLFPRMNAVAVKALSPEPMPWPAFRTHVKELQEIIEKSTGLTGAPEEYWEMDPEAAAEDREARRKMSYESEATPHIMKEIRHVRLDKAEHFMAELGIPREMILKGGDLMLKEIDEAFEKETGSAVSVPDAFGTQEQTSSTDTFDMQDTLPDSEKEQLSAAAQIALPVGTSELIHQFYDAMESRENGAWRDLPEDIWEATMACYPRFISEYRRSYGTDGFDRFFWTTRQRDAKLFRIGALEYEMITAENGDPVISVHIPSDVELMPENLDLSMEKARAFFKEYFPEWADAPMVCESWLLSPLLKELLPESSHILMFQRAFDILETDPDSEDALEWVFHIAGGQRGSFKAEELKEDTSLQRKLKALYLKGIKPGAARGVLMRRFGE
ncbi:MAG: family 20 glycosylhydrolase [Lachnospiraceae bacterium]|nr:family 20 glycosylhydrolase [Lachnospiraceae bacterium]